DPSRGRAPQEGSRHREGVAHLESPEGGEGHPRAAEEDRGDQAPRPERDGHRGGHEDGGGYGALHGLGGGGLMRTHGKHYRADVATLELLKLYGPREAVGKGYRAADPQLGQRLHSAAGLGD